MLTIVNENNLVGTILDGMSPDGATEWRVSGIGKGLHHYIIYLKRNDNDWEREVKLYRKHFQKLLRILYLICQLYQRRHQ